MKHEASPTKLFQAAASWDLLTSDIKSQCSWVPPGFLVGFGAYESTGLFAL